MTWPAILVLAGGSYLLKLAGLAVFTEDRTPAWLLRVGALLPAALLTALVLVGTFESEDGGFTVDARVAGLAAAVVAVMLRAPFIVVITAGAAATALVRAIG